MQWTGPGIKASAIPHNAHVSIIDIFPTICEIIGAEIPMGVQGRSLWPLLQERISGTRIPEASWLKMDLAECIIRRWMPRTIGKRGQ